MMSWLCMRMHPYEANVPIDSGRFVPWMAYSPPEGSSPQVAGERPGPGQSSHRNS